MCVVGRESMTYYLLQSIMMVSETLWRVSENAANNADLDLFLDATWQNPAMTQNFQSGSGSATQQMADTLNLLPFPGWLLRDPWVNNINLRGKILGYIITVQDKPATNSDCISDSEDYG